MRANRARKLTFLGTAVAVSLLGALLAVSQSSAQYPTYPPYPTTTTPTTTTATPPSGTTSASNSVTVAGTTTASYHFQPHKLSIKKGSTVKWNWASNAPHNVTFKKLGKHSRTGASETFKLKFKHTGTFRYLCTVHGFRGKIVVH
jgi:plastocyanin